MPRSVLILLLVAVPACYRSTGSSSRASCPDSWFASVSNNWNRAVDVYAWNGIQSLVLGTVTAGASAQFLMPRSAVSVSYRTEGGGAMAPMGPTSPIQTRYVCR
jgi:hypothetical protein